MRLLKHTLVIAGLIHLLGLNISFGQSIQINLIQFYKDEAIITYSIKGIKKAPCSIKVFSSIDNFKTPLNFVIGDVGDEVVSGDNKKAIVYIKKQFGDYKGDIAFQISCNLIETLVVKPAFRRGKQYTIRWSAVNNQESTVKIELLNRAQQKVWEDDSVPNTGRYNWKVPLRIRRGRDYKLRFTGIENGFKSKLTNSFDILPKTPLSIKVIGVSLIGGLVFIVKGHKESANPGTLPEFSSIGFPD